MKHIEPNYLCQEFLCVKKHTCMYAPQGDNVCKTKCREYKCDLCYLRLTCRRKENG